MVDILIGEDGRGATNDDCSTLDDGLSAEDWSTSAGLGILTSDSVLSDTSNKDLITAFKIRMTIT